MRVRAPPRAQETTIVKVLIADSFETSGRDALDAAGCAVIYQPALAAEPLAQAIEESAADVLVVRSTTVTAAMLERGSLSLVVRAGAGCNTIDVAAASRRGIYIANCPGQNAAAVAELTFGLILALDRQIPDAVADLRAGAWNKAKYSEARGLAGRTLGLLGYGSIGQAVAARARAFGMPVVVWSRRFDAAHEGRRGPAAADGIRVASSPVDVAAQCDVLSLHLALTTGTRGLVDAAVLDALRPGSLLVNTARAELVDQEPLARVVLEKRVRLGTDVFAAEPKGGSGAFDDPVAALPGVYGTPHIGASTEQAQEAIAAETVRVILTYARTGEVPNVVNLAARTPATHCLVVRHRDRPGVLADIFARLRQASINAQETANIVFDGAEAAIARINVDTAPPLAVLDAMRGCNADVLDVRLIAIAH